MLNAEQILALAPDAASARAGTQLATPGKWDGLGLAGDAMWGECQGSGKLPYRTQIDLSEPAFKCTCPSRKFPCKHGLGLYLLHAGHPVLFTVAETPPWVADWLAGRRDRREKKEEKASGKMLAQTPEEAALAAVQARKRDDKREQNIGKGLIELQTWLEDLAREGLVGVRERGPGYWETMAARMVDAQAGGLAARLRRASSLCFQSTHSGWEERLGAELAALYMLSHAYGHLARLPPALQCDVRAQVGWTVAQEDVLSEEPVSDCWQVLAQYTTDEGRVRARVTWLRASASGRWALLLHYAAGAQGFEVSLPVGTEFDGELCFFPGAWPLRAVVKSSGGSRPLDAALLPAPPLAAALEAHADALAAQPFLERTPLLLAGVPDPGQRTLFTTVDGRRIALHPSFRHPLHLLALSGGYPLTLVGEWDGSCLLPLSVAQGGRLYNIETDFAA